MKRRGDKALTAEEAMALFKGLQEKYEKEVLDLSAAQYLDMQTFGKISEATLKRCLDLKRRILLEKNEYEN